MKKRNLVIILIILIILYILFNNITFDIDFFKEYINGFGIYAFLIYILIYILFTLLGFSSTFFTILAGVLFPLSIALFLVILSSTIAAFIAFHISRFLGKKYLKNILNFEEHHKFIKDVITHIEKNFQKNGFKTFLVLRLSMFPYIPLSYAAGLVKKVNFKDFIFPTFIANLIISPFYIFLGFSIFENTYAFIAAIILILFLVLISIAVKKLHRKKI